MHMDGTLPIGIVKLQAKPAIYHIGYGIVGQIKPGYGWIVCLIGYVISFKDWVLQIGQPLIALLNDALSYIMSIHCIIVSRITFIGARRA